jgi:DNA-binding GntR family transcriptional regulator
MRRATNGWATTARAANSSDLAAEMIRGAILDGTLTAGSRLKEDELAAQLEVSRTPVREALRKLAADDLVVLEPKRGARVRKYEAHELDDLYRLRAVLEGYAARRAAERIEEHELDALRGSCNRFARLAARKRVSAADLAAENQVFHEGVLAAARDHRLAAMARSVIHLPLVYKAYIWFSPEDRRASADFHWQVTEALTRRDGAAAAHAMEQHVLAARDQLIGALPAEDGDG